MIIHSYIQIWCDRFYYVCMSLAIHQKMQFFISTTSSISVSVWYYYLSVTINSKIILSQLWQIQSYYFIQICSCKSLHVLLTSGVVVHILTNVQRAIGMWRGPAEITGISFTNSLPLYTRSCKEKYTLIM